MGDGPQQISPEEAINEYLESLVDHKDTTVRNHDTRLAHFRQWCEVTGITSMSEVTGRRLHKYRSGRAEQVKKNHARP